MMLRGKYRKLIAILVVVVLVAGTNLQSFAELINNAISSQEEAEEFKELAEELADEVEEEETIDADAWEAVASAEEMLAELPQEDGSEEEESKEVLYESVIKGFVWLDENQNGEREKDEAGMNGIELVLEIRDSEAGWTETARVVTSYDSEENDDTASEDSGAGFLRSRTCGTEPTGSEQSLMKNSGNSMKTEYRS